MFENLKAGWNACEHSAKDGSTLLYQIHMPDSLEDGKQYPLIVYMHGAGSKSDDNTHIYSPFSHFLRNFESGEYRNRAILLAPCCPKSGRWVQCRDWKQTILDHTVEPTVQMQAVIEILDTVTVELPIDTKRLYIHGNSMGAHATWELLSRFPGRFAAAVPGCGGGDPRMAHKKLDTAIWIFHGDADQTVPYECSVIMNDALTAAGHKNFKFTTFPGAGHGISKNIADSPDLWNGCLNKVYRTKNPRITGIFCSIL